MANVVKFIALSGRGWTEDTTGKSAVQRKYKIVLDAPLEIGSEELPVISGLPKVGDKFSAALPNLKVDTIDIEEGTDKEKNCLFAAVKYRQETFTVSEPTEEGEVSFACEEWGWESNFTEEELLHDQETGAAVLNSAGDPYDSAPTFSASTPIFRKVVKTETLQSGVMDFDGAVNSSDITIGGILCSARTLLCSVSMKRVFGDANYKYAYTITLKKRDNYVKVNGSYTNAGWDAAVVDAGMRIKSGDKKVIATVIDEETGTPCRVTSSVLLDGSGGKLASGSEPVNVVHKAYAGVNFPAWFYSEPA